MYNQLCLIPVLRIITSTGYYAKFVDNSRKSTCEIDVTMLCCSHAN